LRRSWRWSAEWTVHDSEGRLVGAIVETASPLRGLWSSRSTLPALRIEDCFGRRLAKFAVKNPEAAGLFTTPDNIELAWLNRRDGETELTFADAARDNPFTRMLLLAASLACD
jgi:hypothetical protein